MSSDFYDDNSNNNSNLASFHASPCQYHRGHALKINNLSLSHAGAGRSLLFGPADFVLKHGCVTGLVGVNGSGKTSLARLLASQQLPDFPKSLTVEYLAASDDEEFLAGSTSTSATTGSCSRAEDDSNDDGDENGEDYASMMALKPIEYIQRRIRTRSDRLQANIDELEQRLEQDDDCQDEKYLMEITDRLSDLYELQEALDEKVQREMDCAIQELGLAEYTHKSLSQLSSGWRYKCRLVAAFLTHPDLLIIDEPSFLDDASTEWFMQQTLRLAKHQSESNSMILFISHKEALLDALCDEILYINAANQSLTTYHCGYSTFRSTHQVQVQHALKTVAATDNKFQKAEQSLKHVKTQLKSRERNLKTKTTQNADQRFIKGKNKEAKQKADKTAASKVKQAERRVQETQELKRQAQEDRVKPLRIDGVPAAAEGSIIISLQDVAVTYNNNANADDKDDWVFENVDVCMEATDRILLTGFNGCGKSTLVKTILGEIEPSRGSVTRRQAGNNFIYFPQTVLSQLLRNHGQETAREFIAGGSGSDSSDDDGCLTETQARQHLGNFGLARDLAVRPLATLSAGQRVRLWLAKEHLRHPQPCLLVLDEISENVDVETRKSLVDLLSSFEGAVLVVSHDADFRNSFQPTKTWELGRYGVREVYAE